MEYLTTAGLSEQWGITPRRIGVLCADGRIKGAIKDPKKPLDKRSKKHGSKNVDFIS